MVKFALIETNSGYSDKTLRCVRPTFCRCSSQQYFPDSTEPTKIVCATAITLCVTRALFERVTRRGQFHQRNLEVANILANQLSQFQIFVITSSTVSFIAVGTRGIFPTNSRVTGSNSSKQHQS
jgi:hypothetical protein